MYKLLTRAEIDDQAWNECVLSSPYFRHYALTYYLDNSCEHWVGVVGEGYEWVWPLPIKRFPVKRIVQPLLSQQLGPLGNTMLTEHQICDLIRALKSRFQAISIKFNDNLDQLECLETHAGRNIELNLQMTYEELFKNYNRTIRSNLKKAEKAEIRIEKSFLFDSWAIQTFKRFRGKEIPALNDRFYKQVELTYLAFKERNQAFTVKAIGPEGSCLAQALFLHTGGRLLLFYSANDYDSGIQGAMHSIVDYVIKTMAGERLILDFEGSNDDNLAYFYRSFGGIEKVYLHGRYSNLSWPWNRLLSV